MKQNNCHQTSLEDEQTSLQENSINAYFQNVELSSKDDYFPQKEEALLRIDLSRFPDGTRVVRVHPNVVLDIPDNYLGLDRGLLQGKHEHNSCIEGGYLSEEHRKEQLAYLNGRLPKGYK